MIRRTLFFAGTMMLGLAVVGCAAKGPSIEELTAQVETYKWPDPTRFDEAFEKFDAEGEQPTGAIVAIGSSSMRGWHKMMGEDLAPLTIIPRGFGGSTMYDALHFVDRGVIDLKPRAVMLYEGDNDVTWGLPAEAVIDAFRAFKARIHAADPKVRIHVFSIKPSPARMDRWPEMMRANELLRLECEADKRLFLIDVSTPLLDEDGQPLEELFVGDRVHMNRAGYERWRDAVRAAVLPIEEKYEK